MKNASYKEKIISEEEYQAIDNNCAFLMLSVAKDLKRLHQNCSVV